jgi:Domain of unknown function (DUF6378)
MDDQETPSVNSFRAEMGMPAYEPESVNKRAKILQTAENLINGDRAQSYGPPEISFSRIANLWTAMGMAVQAQAPGEDIRYRPVNATDVSLALIQLKAARLVASPDHEDSWVDIAGYAGLGGEIALNGVRESDGAREEVKLDTVNFNQVTYFKPTAEDYGYVVCSDCGTCCRREEVALHAKKSHGKTAYILDRDAADAFVQVPNPQAYYQICFEQTRIGRRNVWRCTSCDAMVLTKDTMGIHASLHGATVYTQRLQ